jgi:hypothetical protein
MRYLTRRGAAAVQPTGLAFEIADLVLLQAWAERHRISMQIRLDHAVQGEEYEEVIAVHAGAGNGAQLIIWRNAASVFVQPLVGRRQKFTSLSEALDSVLPKHAIKLTDIAATAWPAT